MSLLSLLLLLLIIIAIIIAIMSILLRSYEFFVVTLNSELWLIEISLRNPVYLSLKGSTKKGHFHSMVIHGINMPPEISILVNRYLSALFAITFASSNCLCCISCLYFLNMCVCKCGKKMKIANGKGSTKSTESGKMCTSFG